MTKNKIVSIVIPVYKENITNNERISLRQCIKILSTHIITLISPNGLNLNTYLRENPNFKVEYFDGIYFKNLKGYNKLMASYDFYKRFEDYDYLLIYHLDAYVFRDELDYWCNQGYDYIGAPWFKDFSNSSEVFLGVGNGGFSLRKIRSFLKVFTYKLPLYPPSIIWSEYLDKSLWCKIRFGIPAIIKSLYRFDNKVQYYLKEVEKNLINEDYFWSEILKKSWLKFNTPIPEVALKFSFEMNPSFLFEKNGRKLPFGCHAWFKNEFNSFYKPYILGKRYYE
jgi:hypothetical protein